MYNCQGEFIFSTKYLRIVSLVWKKYTWKSISYRYTRDFSISLSTQHNLTVFPWPFQHYQRNLKRRGIPHTWLVNGILDSTRKNVCLQGGGLIHILVSGEIPLLALRLMSITVNFKQQQQQQHCQAYPITVNLYYNENCLLIKNLVSKEILYFFLITIVNF